MKILLILTNYLNYFGIGNPDWDMTDIEAALRTLTNHPGYPFGEDLMCKELYLNSKPMEYFKSILNELL